MKSLLLSAIFIIVCLKTNCQNLVLSDSSGKQIAIFTSGSKIKKEQLILAKKIEFVYPEGNAPEFDFYLSTGISDPFVKLGIYGNRLDFDFAKHLGKIRLKEEATMVFDVRILRTKTGGQKFDKGAVFYIIE